MVEQLELSFDRTVPKDLLAALAPEGPFHDLVEAVKRFPNSPLDLQLRARKGDSHATLYLGLTKILDLRLRGGRFWLTGQADTKTFGEACRDLFDSDWSKPQPLAELDATSRRLRGSYVEAIVNATSAGKASRYVDSEGALQARLSHFPDQLTVLDREVVVGFANEQAKQRRLDQVREPVADAIDRLRESGDAWTFTLGATPAQRESGRGQKTTGFGDELDALALDPDGRVLVIEAKHGNDTGGVGWTPAQVAVYLGLVRAWVDQNSEAAAATLERMLAQRRSLGLAPNQAAGVARPLELVPVIVIGDRARNPAVANERMTRVRDALAGCGEPLDRAPVVGAG